uniref:Uncharacterized protein n=1 Tax=Marinobacter nauticus TaxID=2743 RepID=A0A455W540_MARNT|nr:hypothetical protein YBY_22580 [Marinobacter nauticus]
MTLKYVESIQGGILKIADLPVRTVPYRDDAELVILLKELVEQGYAFLDTPSGWPPAAVLQQLQEQGDLDFPFTAVTWSGSGKYRTYQVPAC